MWLKHPVRFPNNGSDIVFREKIENIVGHEAIETPYGLYCGERPIRKSNLRLRDVGREALAREFYHRRAEINAPVAPGFGKIFREETKGKPSCAAAKFEDPIGAAELAMADEKLRRGVLVKRLGILPRSDAVVDAPGLFSRQRGHIHLGHTGFHR